MYPTKAEIDGKIYAINTDFKVALKCFKVIEDETIGDNERALAIIYLLFGFMPKENHEEFLKKAQKFLEGPYEKIDNSSKERDIDFEQDMKYILASFYSEYKIDLELMDMHFWKFLDFLSGLSENTILHRIRTLRNIDLNEITDDKRRKEIAEAQSLFAIKYPKTQEELEADKLWEEQMKGCD